MIRALIVAAMLGCSLGSDYEESVAACRDAPPRPSCGAVVSCPAIALKVRGFTVARPLVMDIDGKTCTRIGSDDDGNTDWCCS